MRRHLAATVAVTAALVGLFVAPTGCKGEAKRVDRAGSGSASATPTPAPAAIAKPFLWKADKDGATTWLFGTIHIGVDAAADLPPWVGQRLDAAPVFVMEADTSDVGALAQALQRHDGGSLRNDLGPAYWEKLEGAIGAKLAAGFDGMKPFAVMTLLIAKDLPMTPPMDGVLSDRAKAAGKPVRYLETALDQLALIDPWMSTADIKALLDNRELARTTTLEMLAAYRAGDERAMGAMFEDQRLWLAAGRKPETFPAYVDALLARRNRAWVPKLEELHAAGGAFVAVGAGHLVGPKNVLDLLAERGFTVTRVTGP